MSSLFVKKSDSSPVLVFVYAAMFVGIGGFLGLLYMMSFPLEAYANLAERDQALEARESSDPMPGGAYYIEGATMRSRAWETKRQQLINGSASTIRLSASEINGWLAANFRSSAISGDDSADMAIVPGMPNLGISEDGVTYLNLPADISGYGLSGEHVFSAQVHFNEGTPATFGVGRMQISGAAIPLAGILGAKMVSTLMGAFSSAEEYSVIREAWSRVSSVEVSGDSLVLSLKVR
jgi:hypothetical protein